MFRLFKNRKFLYFTAMVGVGSGYGLCRNWWIYKRHPERLRYVNYNEDKLNEGTARVRIWRAGYFTKEQPYDDTIEERKFIYNGAIAALMWAKWGDGNIGHVSLETDKYYVSLWPTRMTVFNKLKPLEMHQETKQGSMTPVKDIMAEKREPDVIVDLHSLDTEKMRLALSKFQKTGKYKLINRPHFFSTKKVKVANCSSLARDLLVKGGIEQRPYKKSVTRNYFIVTPHNLAKMVIEANKLQEASFKHSNSI